MRSCMFYLLSDMKKILELDSSNDQAKKTIRRLEPLAEQKREKMKEEMIGRPSTVLKLFFSIIFHSSLF